MDANFEALSPEEDVAASREKERVMREKCSLIVEFYVCKFVFEGSGHEAITEDTLKLLIQLVCLCVPGLCCLRF